jgi:hypothetical protein
MYRVRMHSAWEDDVNKSTETLLLMSTGSDLYSNCCK